MECFACSDTAVKGCPNGHGLCDDCIDDAKWGIPNRINCCSEGPTFDEYFSWFTKSKRKQILKTLIAPAPDVPVTALVKEAFAKTLLHHCPKCNVPFDGFDGCCILTHDDCCIFCGVCDDVFPHYTETCDVCATPVDDLGDISRCPTCDLIRFSSKAEASKAAHLHFEYLHSDNVYDTNLYRQARKERTLNQMKALADDLALPKLVKFLPHQEDLLVQHLDDHYPSRIIKQTFEARVVREKKKTVCRYWARGVCRNRRCRFAHGEHELV